MIWITLKKMQKVQKNTHRVWGESNIALAIQLIFARVVSTILSGGFFARFHTVDPFSKRSAFYLLNQRWSKKFHVRKKVHFQWVGLVRAVFSLSFLSLTVYDVTKKAWYGRNILNCTETSIKNARHYSRDYSNFISSCEWCKSG